MAVATAGATALMMSLALFVGIEEADNDILICFAEVAEPP
jgi:hypothetical protein